VCVCVTHGSKGAFVAFGVLFESSVVAVALKYGMCPSWR
jgi:hypothetical protein